MKSNVTGRDGYGTPLAETICPRATLTKTVALAIGANIEVDVSAYTFIQFTVSKTTDWSAAKCKIRANVNNAVHYMVLSEGKIAINADPMNPLDKITKLFFNNVSGAAAELTIWGY